MDEQEVNVKLTVYKKEGSNLKAFGSITSGPFQINCRVMNSSKGLFVGLPSNKKPDGSYQDEVVFTSKEARASISKKVLDLYQNLLSTGSSESVALKSNNQRRNSPELPF